MDRKLRDFSYNKYEELCQVLVNAGYKSLTIQQYLKITNENKILPERIVLLRHDVDRVPNLAFQLAKLESKAGLHTTYYFRTHPASFNTKLIADIHQLGHEIGYHYETLSDADGDIELALELFAKNLTILRKIVPVNTIAMHGRPLSRWDNRHIWKHAGFDEYNLLGEAYLSLDYDQIDYFSDTGRTWHPSKYNLKDNTLNPPRYYLQSTDDLINHINSGKSNQLCILTHPERWPSNAFHWVLQGGIDISINLIKGLYLVLNRH